MGFSAEMGNKIREAIDEEHRAADDHRARAMQMEKAWRDYDYVTLAEMQVISWKDAVEFRIGQVGAERGIKLRLVQLKRSDVKHKTESPLAPPRLKGKFTHLDDVLLQWVITAPDAKPFILPESAWYTAYVAVMSEDFTRWLDGLKLTPDYHLDGVPVYSRKEVSE
jgi:hypothetical protein